MVAPPEKFDVATATFPSGATAKASPGKDSGVRVNPAGGTYAAWEWATDRRTTTRPIAWVRIGGSFLRGQFAWRGRRGHSSLAEWKGSRVAAGARRPSPLARTNRK